jgi:peptidyl-prolyl cis-trans isomerase D
LKFGSGRRSKKQNIGFERQLFQGCSANHSYNWAHRFRAHHDAAMMGTVRRRIKSSGKDRRPTRAVVDTFPGTPQRFRFPSMITWIQTYFQRHFRTIFVGLLAVVIITFILGVNATGTFGLGDGRGRDSQPFFGLDLANPVDAKRLRADAELNLSLADQRLNAYARMGIPIQLGDAQIEGYARSRHAALWLAEQLGVPQPGKTEFDAYLRTLPAFAGETGRFDPATYNRVLDNIASSPNLTLGDVARVIGESLRAIQVENLLAGPGYLLPSEARALVDLNDATWSLALATVDYASFAPTIPEPATAELEKFYQANPDVFLIPPQVRVDAIEFAAEAFLAKVPALTEAEVRKFYDDNPAAFTKPEEKAPPPLLAKPEDKPADAKAKTDADFAAARAKVEDAMRQDRARRLAAAAASDLAVDLFRQKLTPATLAPYLASRQLTLKSLPPFSRDAAPAELGTALDTAAAAFRLDAARPFSDSVVIPAGSAILVWRESLPARQPAFAEVRDRAAIAWRAAEKQRLFTELGKTLRDRLAGAIKAGEKFEDAAAAAATALGVKIEVKPQSGFTLAQKRDAGSFDAVAPLLSSLETLQKGGLTELVVVPGDTQGAPPKSGLLAYAVEKTLPDPASPESAARRAQLAFRAAAYSATVALKDLVDRELPPVAATP